MRFDAVVTETNRASGRARPRTVALIAFLIATATAGIVVWQSEVRRVQIERSRLQLRVVERGHFLEASLERALSAAQTLAVLVEHADGAIPDFNDAAKRILADHPGASALGLAPGGVITHVYPRAGNEAAIGFDLFHDPTQSKEALLARDSDTLRLAGPLRLVQGGMGAVGRVAVRVPGPDGQRNFWGLAYVIIRFPDVLEHVFGESFRAQGFGYRLTRLSANGSEQELLGASGPDSLPEPVLHRVNVPNGRWLLAVAPANGWGDPAGLAVKLGLGLLFSTLVALIARLVAQLRARQANLEALVAQRTAELEASHSDLEQAQAVAHTGSWVAEEPGPDGEPAHMAWSTEAYRIFGLTPGAPVSFNTFVSSAHPEDRGRLEGQLARARQEPTLDIEFRIVSGSSIRHVRCRAQRETGPDGAVVRILGTLQDVTESRIAQTRLRESEERLSLAMEGSSDGHWDVQLPAGTTYLSPRCCEILGYQPDELSHVAPFWRQLVHPEDVGRSEQALREYIAGDAQQFDVEQRLRTADGGWKWIHARGKAVSRDASGRPTRMAGTFTDVSEQRAIQEALRESESRYRTLIESAPVAVLVNRADRVVLTNRSCLDLFGADRPEELLGRSVFELFDPADHDRIRARVATMRETGQPAPVVEERIRRLDGTLVEVAVSAAPFVYQGVKAIHVVLTDLSARKRSEAALKASEGRFQRLLHGVSTIAVQGYRADGTIHYWNRASELLYGYTAAEAVGKNLLELIIPPDLREKSAQTIRQMVETRHPAPAEELSLVRRGGARVDVFSSHAVIDVPGQDPELFCIDVDLTQRKRTEQALRQSEEMFSRMFQGSPAMMALSTIEDGTLLEVNERFLQNSGFTREEILGRTSIEAGWVKEDQRRVLADRIKTEGRIKDADAVMYRKDGQPIHVLYSGELVSIGGRPLLLSSWVDVTDRRRVEEQLRLQGSALEAAANAIVITDSEGRMTWANAAFTRTTGYTLDETRGTPLGEIVHTAQNPPGLIDRMWRTIRSGQVWNGEVASRRKDGTLYTEEITVTPVRNQDGAIVRYIAVKQDVTQRRILEEKFRQAQKMEAVGQLAGGIAHDFNNIMAGVLMYLSMLQDSENLDDETRTALRDLTREVQRGAGLTRQLLAFSRQQAMVPVQVELNDVLAGLLKMLRRLLGEHILIALNPAAGLPRVEADIGMLEQVVINLAVNARDAMPRGGNLTLGTDAVHVENGVLAPHPDARPGDFVRLSVTDTGSGMDSQTVQRIFEPFFTTKPAGKGTGLGLATVYGIVKQHQGWVEVESAVGHGTTFFVYLPVSTKAMDPQQPPSAAPRPRAGNEIVMVVEDEPSVRAVAALSLRRVGYTVLEAASGPEALKLWTEHEGSPEILVTDMVMPGGMTGRELATELRRLKPSLAIIICTGYSQAMADHPLEPEDKITLLPKPFDASTLAQAVRRGLDERTGR